MVDPSRFKYARGGLSGNPTHWVQGTPVTEFGTLPHGVYECLETVLALPEIFGEVILFLGSHTPRPIVGPRGQVPRTRRTVALPVPYSVKGGGQVRRVSHVRVVAISGLMADRN